MQGSSVCFGKIIAIWHFPFTWSQKIKRLSARAREMRDRLEGVEHVWAAELFPPVNFCTNQRQIQDIQNHNYSHLPDFFLQLLKITAEVFSNIRARIW